MLRGIRSALVAGLVANAALGCTFADQAEKFREPIPTAADVALETPREQTTTPAKSSLATTAPTGYAKYYQFTRNVNDAVDVVTAVVLGSVWLVVHTPPTTIDSHHAVWGPGQGDALSPVVWRLTVTEVSKGEFDYQLDGRPKDSTAEADYLAVLKGHGHGRAHKEHRDGWFSIDNDAARTLDPARAHDNGTVKIAHQLRDMPTTIAVELRPTATPTWTDITVTHQADRSGAVDISAYGDIEDIKDGNLEDIVMHSRWAATGAGRADVQISGGDMPSLVKASECWGTSFTRTYYTDNVSYQPTEGDPAACAFAVAAF
jgi:hypothetical protein